MGANSSFSSDLSSPNRFNQEIITHVQEWRAIYRDKKRRLKYFKKMIKF